VLPTATIGSSLHTPITPARDQDPAQDEALALALLRGEPEALRKAEACALADTMPLSRIARMLLLAARSGREAVLAQDRSRARVAAAWEAALLCSGALDAQETLRQQDSATRSARRRTPGGGSSSTEGDGI